MEASLGVGELSPLGLPAILAFVVAGIGCNMP